jgi:ABC-type branched-subunit amino acid transport system ATPase component/branched-subunit amino acid ABC-type transport system permease component
MRAVVDRDSLASLRGINRDRTSALAWILTMILAGLGGVLIAPLFQLNPDLFTLIVFGSLFAVVLGGLRSIPIAFFGGLVLGVGQDLIAGYSDSFLPHFLHGLSGFRSSIPFLLTLLLVFIVREPPPDELPPADHRAGLPAWRRRLPWVLTTVVLLAFALQWTGVAALQADVYEQGLIARGLAVGIIFLSFVVVTGLGGMVSLAQASFVVAGGFAAGWALSRDWGVNAPLLAHHGHLNFALAALIGAGAGAGLGVLVALIVAWRRVGPVALAIATFALAFWLAAVPFGTQAISHGSTGWSIPAPSLSLPGLNWVKEQLVGGAAHFDFSQPADQVVLLLVLFGLLTLMIHALVRSASGRAMLAVRSSETAARTSGLAPRKTKILIFAVSAGIAGFGGVLFSMVSGAALSTNALPQVGLIWLAVAVVFGVRRPGGALLAGLAFACTAQIFIWIGHDFLSGAFGQLTTSSFFVPILFGLGAINLAQNPDGLLALVGHRRLERRNARLRRERIAEAEQRVDEAPSPASDDVVAAPPGVEGQSAALMLRGVSGGYGDVEVVHEVDLEVGSGTVLALLGANGAGKSTLCSVVSGLIPATRGRVIVDGRDVTSLPAYQRVEAGLLLVPEARGVFPGLTVEENLRIMLRSPDERAAAYDRFPILAERRRQRAGLLSGGEQQMLSLATALARPPDVFVADEPTLGLAPLAAEVVLRAVRELRDRGCAVMLVEEKAREVLEIADTVAFMELGRVAWIGARDEADEERLAASYLGATT